MINEDLVFKALGDSSRRFLLDLLHARDGQTLGELEWELEMTRFGVMKHLKVLEEAGLVEARREGTRHLYAVRPEGFAPVASFVQSFWGTRLDKLKRALDE
jgi:DNA-binding transcriptional ArsR family regulator